MMSRANGFAGAVALGTLALVAMLVLAPHATRRAAPLAEGDMELRRLTPDQYRNIIADVFGRSVKFGGRFEPGIRQTGLLAVGASTATVTASAFEQYDQMARSIAASVVDARHRGDLIPCVPKAPDRADPDCARAFLAPVGRLLFRRALGDAEIARYVGLANASATSLKDFYAGLATSLATLLVSPDFLFRQETTEADPHRPGQWRLTAYAKASRLSFLLWNTAPDDALLRAAEDGRLNSEEGLSREVDRMLQSSRLEAGVRAFFADFLEFDGFQTLAKDALIYPKYTDAVTEEAREQMLRTISDVLLTHGGDYRDLFTTKKTFMTPLLGSIYRVPLATDAPWQPYEFSNDRPTAGILTLIGFTALHSHPGRSSPTLRGRAIRQELLCQTVPDPPANVNFSLLQDTTNPRYRTARERVKAHTSVAICAGCHKLTDPIGLALETYDTTGQDRATENGAPIDASGELDGVAYKDAAGLGQAVHDNPALPACLAARWYSYMTGRSLAISDNAEIGALEHRFREDGYRIVPLMRDIAVDERSYKAPPPAIPAAGVTAESGNTEYASK
jgi:hypothetical protein